MVFISYRRDDSGGHVGRLYDALSARLGRQRIFFDIDHIAPGQDFVQVLESSLSRSAVMLVVIGKRWAGSGKIGARRIDHPGDFVRLEVATGLRRPELRVIPVLIQGAKMPGAGSLPDELKDLSRRNAIELSDLRWKEDVARLIAGLEGAAPSGGPRTVTLPGWLTKARTMPALPPWSKWVAVAAVVLLLGWVARGAFTTRAAGAPSESAVAGESNTLKEIPTGDPPKLPARLARAARAVLPAARKWRADAVLTGIEAQAPDSGAPSDEYRVNYDFRSPSDGAGLKVATSASGEAAYTKLPPAGKSATRALPDSFVDLPDAIAAAREAGMFGQLRLARLSPSTSGSRSGRPTWTIRPFAGDQAQVYYIDGLTGKLIPVARRKGGLIGKVEGIFR